MPTFSSERGGYADWCVAEGERLEQLAGMHRDLAERLGERVWRGIETAEDDEVGIFWLEFKDEEACLNPNWQWAPMAHYHIGKNRCWGSCYKATHWMPLPAAPETPS